MSKGWVAVALGVVAVALGAAVLAGGYGDRPADNPATDYARMHAAMCEAADALAAGDTTEARNLFFGRAHSALHALAHEVSHVDRALAGNLLRSKNRVEGALGSEAAPRVAGHFDDLLRYSAMALESSGEPYSPCPR